MAEIKADLAVAIAEADYENGAKSAAWRINALLAEHAPQPASEAKACVTGQCPDKQSCNEAQCCLYAAPQPAVPEGWVMVPREPTEAMVQAAFDALPGYALEGNIRRHYRAMLAAAPDAGEK